MNKSSISERLNNGITLVELMVAMGIFVFIGVATIGMLRTGLNSWRTGEIRRESLETAQMVLSQISQDIQSIYTQGVAEGLYGDVKLISDFDSNGRQRIRFVRTVAGAISPYAHREAGAFLDADRELDLVEDYMEARMGLLLATGGLCEIAYVMEQDAYSSGLYRGLRSPVGGSASFFIDSNMVPTSANYNLIQFADGILYLGFKFWTQYTNTWKSQYWPLIDPMPGEKSGPAFWWDSTRSKIPPFQLEDREFTTYLDGSSQYNSEDDIFPRAIRIVLVVSEGDNDAKARLTRDINEESSRIPIDNTGLFSRSSEYPYVKIDDEWICYSQVGRDELVLDEYGRGARFTYPQAHSRGTVVRVGRTFSLIVWLPGGREDWNGK